MDVKKVDDCIIQLQQAKDITDLGSLKEAAKIFVPGIIANGLGTFILFCNIHL